MRIPRSLHDLSVLTVVLYKPLEKSTLARRALTLVGGPTFDDAVAVATVDRQVLLGALRKVRARYEITREGRAAMGDALQDHRAALEEIGRLGSPWLVEDPDRGDLDALAPASARGPFSRRETWSEPTLDRASPRGARRT
jgi:hypothetical protein